MKPCRSERKTGRRKKKAGCFPTAGSAHLISGTTASLELKVARNLASESDPVSIQPPYVILTPALKLNSHCSPSWRDHSAHCTARSPQHIHVAPQVKILNQPTFHKCTIHTRHQCQSGQTAGMGTKAPLSACTVPDIPSASWG